MLKTTFLSTQNITFYVSGARKPAEELLEMNRLLTTEKTLVLPPFQPCCLTLFFIGIGPFEGYFYGSPDVWKEAEPGRLYTRGTALKSDVCVWR